MKKLISLPIDDAKLVKKYKAIWTRIVEKKSIKLNLGWCCAWDFMDPKFQWRQQALKFETL